jgi:DNA uptake protein ComE-like DNA-binding protein
LLPSWLAELRRRRRPGVLWALVPLFSIGLGAAPAFFYVAVRYRRPQFFLPALAYLIVMILAVALIAYAQAVTIGTGVAMILACAGIATAHALAVRGEVAVECDHNESHVAAARERLRRRAEARRLAAGDPRLAHELGIGRPDLHTSYDDGGLVDVNHSPPEVIADLPGLDRRTAERIIVTRGEIGGFGSVEELSVTLDLPPHMLDGISDRLLFLRA